MYSLGVCALTNQSPPCDHVTSALSSLPFPFVAFVHAPNEYLAQIPAKIWKIKNLTPQMAMANMTRTIRNNRNSHRKTKELQKMRHKRKPAGNWRTRKGVYCKMAAILPGGMTPTFEALCIP